MGIEDIFANPLLLNILINFAVGLIVTISLNLEVGFADIPQFGRVLTVLMGALVAGGITGRIVASIYGKPSGVEYANHLINYKLVDELSRLLAQSPTLSITMLVLTLIIAAILGGIVGYLCSYPALRLEEAYLGITLLAFGDVLQLVVWNYDPIAGGTEGVMIPDVFRWIGTGPVRFVGATFIILGIALLVFAYAERIARSPFGRSLKAMRDAPLAAEVYGKDIVALRARVLIIGGALAAMGGALWALYTGSFKAVSYSRLTWTFWPWAYMMLGGTGNNVGMLVGVLVFSIVRTLIYTYKDLIGSVIPINPNWLEYMLVGLVIIAISLFRPQGLLPEKPVFALPRKKIEKIRKAVLGENIEESEAKES